MIIFARFGKQIISSVWWILIIALNAGCGQDNPQKNTSYHQDFSGLSIAWSGNILDSQYAVVFENTENCLHDNFGYPYKSNAPTLVLLNDLFFKCGGASPNAVGCYVPDDNMIIIAHGITDTGYPVNHEVVHWMTNLPVSSESDPPFLLCATPPWMHLSMPR